MALGTKCSSSIGNKYSIKAVVTIILIFGVSVLTDIFNLSTPLRHLLIPAQITPSAIEPLIMYDGCRSIPNAPTGWQWAEVEYLHDKEIHSILDIPDPSKSKIWLEGTNHVNIADTLKISIQLYDGRNERRKHGGDLVRVWLREDKLGAKSAAHVIDHKNGSYTAIITAFWEGKPEVHAAIISPREVIATAFKRRYICPPVLMNTAIFQHPSDTNVVEETPCNYDNQIPGYNKICNFTLENYDRPWYCGQPRHERLLCQDWTMIADINLWNTGHEQLRLSNMEHELMNSKYTARKMVTNITLSVKKGDSDTNMLIPKLNCNRIPKSVTWNYTSPTGYFYDHKWINKNCKSNLNQQSYESCLQNTTVVLIGDSTTRQMFERIERMIPCKWVTDKWSVSGKHRPAICKNARMNFSLIWKLHSLPFCTRNTPRHYLKSFNAYLNEIQGNKSFIIVVHFYAHFLNYHSHVFYETLKDLKKGVIALLNRNPNVSIVIKGPHAYSFSKSTDHVIWMPDAYANVYQKLIHNEFRDLSDKVIYLETMDMTVSSEQWHIHSEDFIINSMVDNMLSLVCK